jgi:hypothetical protein
MSIDAETEPMHNSVSQSISVAFITQSSGIYASLTKIRVM